MNHLPPETHKNLTKSTVVFDEAIKHDKLLIIGILSVEQNFEHRVAQRETFLSEKKFAYRFLFDHETPGLLAENVTFGDVVFLNSSFSGRAVAFGEKLLLWLKYAKAHFPDYALYGKESALKCVGEC